MLVTRGKHEKSPGDTPKWHPDSDDMENLSWPVTEPVLEPGLLPEDATRDEPWQIQSGEAYTLVSHAARFIKLSHMLKCTKLRRVICSLSQPCIAHKFIEHC